MGLFGSDKPSSTSSGGQKASGVFGNKKEISRDKFKVKTRDIGSKIRGFDTRRAREEYEKKLSWKRYGSYISKEELMKTRTKELLEEKSRAKTQAERDEKDREIRYIKEIAK